MKKLLFLSILIAGQFFMGCKKEEVKQEEFQFVVDRFADLRILQYQVPGFETLTIQQKKLAYFLAQASLAGRDIFWDQKYKHGLVIRRTFENILSTYTGEKTSDDYKNFIVYVKRTFFSNGIHHHYSGKKFEPGFSYDYFASLIDNSDASKFPLQAGEDVNALKTKLKEIIFNPQVDPLNITTNPEVDMIKSSANNFYENVTQKEVEEFYKKKIDKKDETPVLFGLNSKLTKENGKIVEKVWFANGMYAKAIEQIIFWLEKASTVAENEVQKKWIDLLVEYYKTGDLEKFDEFNVAWVKDTGSIFDAVNGFIETYQDPMGYRATFEGIVSFKDMEATKRIDKISQFAQWFEDNAPFMPEHKKKEVTGISGKVITIVTNSGDAYPASPLGINLPNSDWIRKVHGSKSVNLGNIAHAHDMASASSGALEEFCFSQEEIDRAKKFRAASDVLHTDLHEIIGHGSGQLNPGVATPNETLKNYSAILEEARADLVALYFIMDAKMVEIGLIPSLETGKASYDDYIQNGLINQLVRITLGDYIQQTHMRGRKMISQWAYEMGKKENVIELVKKENKSYFVIKDYDKLRGLFGSLLKEVQRIKSEGDYNAGKKLVENYGVKIDQELHKEILDRYAKLNIAPYSGFMTAILEPVMKGDEIVDVKLVYHKEFIEQNLYLSKKYSFLPDYN